jgi:RNA polymerase sigma-70 factor, ECF subfamily
MTDAAASFLPHRAALVGLVYRMTGSRATAEDIAQEVFLRWDGAERADVSLPRAWLMKAAARLARDYLKSAQVRRETYVGPWLPEPMLEEQNAPQEDAWARTESVSLAFLLALERLSPPERAIFILHDLFDMSFNELAPLLHKSEVACRQLAVRARQRLGEAKPRHNVSETDSTRLAKAFLAATQTGDEVALRELLAEDVVLHTDGGGIRPAALNLIHGAEKTARMLARLALKKVNAPAVLYCGLINGMPGFVTKEPDDLPQVTILEMGNERIAAVYIIRNPEKLSAIAVALGL